MIVEKIKTVRLVEAIFDRTKFFSIVLYLKVVIVIDLT